MKEDFKYLFVLLGILFYIVLYPTIILLLVLYFNLGILSWLIIGISLAPSTAAWYFVNKKRTILYLESLKGTFTWDIDKSLVEYQKLLESSKK